MHVCIFIACADECLHNYKNNVSICFIRVKKQERFAIILFFSAVKRNIFLKSNINGSNEIDNILSLSVQLYART